MDECLYFTNRGDILAWVYRKECPECHEAKMGKPVEKGKVKTRAKEYVCPACGYSEEKVAHEESCMVECQYTCPECGKEGESSAPYKRKTYKGVKAFVVECEHCSAKIPLTKKLKDIKKKKSSANIYIQKSFNHLVKSDKIVVTAALPYANGLAHLGHLLEYIQADIYTRFLKLVGKDCLYICAADQHGTPIEVNAKKEGLTPQEFVKKYSKEYSKDFSSFLIEFDNFYKTHSKENKELSIWFFEELNKRGHIYTKEIEQFYDEKAQRFLPDRYVKGSCPKCKAEDQYGDVCEKCNATYSPLDLVKPYSTISNTTPVLKKSTHYFFKLSSFSSKLKKWINSKSSNIQPEIKNWLNEWLKNGLEDWCISRDAPYFGFEIPNSKKETGEKKYFYVWLDAPIGYLASLKNYCDKQKSDWKDYVYNGQLHHIIGKDIVYFHYLFWPAQFLALDIPLPSLTTHGFITVNGQKMSKSRGTFFTAKEFLDLYPAEALRFFYASHLDRKVIDIDLNFDEFVAVNNNVLTGNLGNFCYRVLTFAQKNYGEITDVKDEKMLTKKITSLTEKIRQNYEQQNFKQAVKNILAIADLGNAYFQNAEPWKEKESKQAEVGYCVNLARNLAILVSPILPEFSKKVLAALGENVVWGLNFTWQGKVKKPELLVQKVEKHQEQAAFPLQLQVGHVKEVIDHPNADSLFIFKVDFGGTIKQCVTSLKKDLPKSAFLNKKIVFCMNMKPAKFRGELSEVMILAAEGTTIIPLEMKKSKPGEAVTPGVSVSSQEISFDEFSKVKLSVKNGVVIYDGNVLKSASEDVHVAAKDGTRVR